MRAVILFSDLTRFYGMRLMLILLLLFVSKLTVAQEVVAIHFDFDKYNLNSAAKTSMDSLAKRIKNSTAPTQLKVSGHTDAIGSNEYNDRLSERRLHTVLNYLMASGIAKQNIISQDVFGENKPLVQNDNAHNRALNRRVEIQILNEIKSPDDVTLKEKLADTTTTVGSNIVLKNINFYGGMHQFLPESAPALNELLEALKTFPKLVIRIEGHICCQDGPADGLDLETNSRNLSESRAKAIMEYLINAGISASRLSYKGFAHTRPIYPYPEQNEEEMKLNRRVEIRIISK